MPVHAVAQSGFGAGTNELYDRIRPSYQPWSLSYIHRALKTPSSLNVVEIGSGTGIFTRALLKDPELGPSVKELRAVEPSEGMRDVFVKAVHDDRVTVAEGTFDATGVESGWADLVVIAQAFHWCPNYNLAAAEFNRILKPNGTLVFIWNLEDRDKARWVAQVRDRIEAHEEGTPQFRLNLWRHVFDTPSYQEAFQPPDEQVWSYCLQGTVDTVVDRASSKSYITVLSDKEKAKVQLDIRAIIQRQEDLRWLDKTQGTFEYPYKTWVVVSQKKQ